MAWTQDQMAAKAAAELQDGFYVNLGIGIPTLVANFVPADIEVWLQSEHCLIGIKWFSPANPDLSGGYGCFFYGDVCHNRHNRRDRSDAGIL